MKSHMRSHEITLFPGVSGALNPIKDRHRMPPLPDLAAPRESQRGTQQDARGDPRAAGVRAAHRLGMGVRKFRHFGYFD